jgi:LmbE family N-acetylglucosaminyl deacetylase
MLTKMGSLLAVLAHPDDEVFRCGGTLALLAQRGVRVQVLTATRGQAGSLGDPPLCSRQELGAMRDAELRCACDALGILPPILLDYEDGALAEIDDEKAVDRIMAILSEIQPQVLLTWPPHGLSRHPDHLAVGRWATRAYQRAAAEGVGDLAGLYYVAVPRSVADLLGPGQLQATADEDIDVTVDVATVWQNKIAAIQCHRTQLAESPILSAPLERQQLFLGTEHFQRAAARSCQDLLSAELEYATETPSSRQVKAGSAKDKKGDRRVQL